MLTSILKTIPTEDRDFHEWRRGRDTYAVWALRLDDEMIRHKFAAARDHLTGYLLESYYRQPHITLFVCGFLVQEAQYNDDFTRMQFQSQTQVVKNAGIQPFEIEIGGLNSFASAPFLEVNDPQRGIARLREVLAQGAREFRTAPYTPHLTVGLYAGAFLTEKLGARLRDFPVDPLKTQVSKISFATYRAQEIAGALTYQDEVLFV
jgi:2'-5' RNA ligase